jgi:hypothetical protein
LSGANYYLLTFLPPLDSLVAQPGLSPAELLDRLEGEDFARPRRLVEAVLLSDDLLQRDAFLAGEVTDPQDLAPAVLNRAQLQDALPLPDELVPEESPAERIASDAVWEAYFRHAADLAQKLASPFLIDWNRFEVTLRNALAEARARALELEPTRYFVAEDLAGNLLEAQSIVQDVAAAENPIDAQRALDQGRWNWLDEHAPYYQFSDDELPAYAARLLLAVRWHRLEAARQHEVDNATP